MSVTKDELLAILGDGNKAKIGDIVSRGCNDEHRIDDVYYDGFMVRVTCLKTQEGDVQWSSPGDVEDNLSKRYILKEK